MIYENHRGVCWTSSSLALIPLTAGVAWFGLILITAWAVFMVAASR